MKDATEEVNSENWYDEYLRKWEEQGWDISAIENFLNSKMHWTVNFMTGHSYSRFFSYQKLPVLLVQDR